MNGIFHIQYTDIQVFNKPVAVVTIHDPVAALDNRTLSPSLWKEDGDASGKEAMLGCGDEGSCSMV